MHPSLRALTPLLLAHFLTFLNNNFLKNALIFLVVTTVPQAEAETLTAFVSATFMAPMIFLSGLGGQIADGFDRSKVARYLKGGELGAIAVAVFGVYISDFWIVLAGLVLIQIVGSLFGPVRGSLIPDLAGDANVPFANALIEAAGYVAMVLGIALVGFAFRQDTAVRDLIATAVLVLSALAFVAVNFVPVDHAPRSGSPVRWNVLASTWSVLKGLAADRTVAVPALSLAWGWFLSSLVLSTAPALIKRAGGDVTDISVGMTVYGISGIIGAQLAARACRRGMNLGAVAGGFAALSLSIAYIGAGSALRGFGGPGTVPLAIQSAMGMASAAFGFVLIPLASAVQTRSNPTMRARTVAASNLTNAVFMVTGGFGVAAMQALGAGLPAIYVACGTLTVAALVVTSIGRFRSSTDMNSC